VKSHTEYMVFETKKRREMVHITDQVEQIVRRSGVKDGLCFVSPMHITAAIYVNDLESGLIEDISKWLEELAPARPDYKHHQTGEDNGDAHLKSLLLHHETTSRDNLAGYRRQTGPRDLATRFLCRVRRATPQAGHREGTRHRLRKPAAWQSAHIRPVEVSDVERSFLMAFDGAAKHRSPTTPPAQARSLRYSSVIRLHSPFVRGERGVDKSTFVAGNTTRSTRRFAALPSAVPLLAIG